ncbi:hypothetical protein BRC85_00125 [Halobacteriales archaeon QS_1_69_70]|nr:MAG: hypothetical protein BRC85_00125 [Halobacteriales archaeon QS_1_69_70]
MHTYPLSQTASPPDDPSPGGLLLFAALLGGVILGVSYPLYSLAALAAVGATAAFGRTLAARLARPPGRVRTVRLPGVAKIRFTVSPR